MKVMTKFAVASALAFCVLGAVQAADIDSISFEDYTADTRTNVVQSGVNDNGTTGGTTDTRWYVTNVVQNDSYVTNVATVYSATCGYPDSFKSATHQQFLKVSTTQPLYRTLNKIPDATAPADNWQTQSVAAAGTYIDTLVQFTPSDNDPVPTSADKIIIWMNASTNLQITASYADYSSESSAWTGDTTNFGITTDIVVQPSKWYRLTVVAVKDMLGGVGDGSVFPGFKVYLDGTILAATNSIQVLGDGIYTLLAEGTPIPATQWAEVTNHTVFCSLAVGRNSGAPFSTQMPTLSAVGFQGEGAIDDYVVTDTMPSFMGGVTALDFTLAWDVSAGVTAVRYVIGDGTTTNDATSGATFTLGTASTVTVIPAYSNWYAAGTWTATAGSTVTAPTFTITASGATGTVVAARMTDPAVAGVTNTTLIAAGSEVVTWALANGISPTALNAGGFAAESYLLNQTSLLSAAPVLAITEIAQDGAAWTIKAKATTSEGTAIKLDTINGGLTVETKDSLDAATWGTQTYAASNLTYDANGVATIKVAGGKFMKAYIQPTK